MKLQSSCWLRLQSSEHLPGAEKSISNMAHVYGHWLEVSVPCHAGLFTGLPRYPRDMATIITQSEWLKREEGRGEWEWPSWKPQCFLKLPSLQTLSEVELAFRLSLRMWVGLSNNSNGYTKAKVSFPLFIFIFVILSLWVLILCYSILLTVNHTFQQNKKRAFQKNEKPNFNSFDALCPVFDLDWH